MYGWRLRLTKFVARHNLPGWKLVYRFCWQHYKGGE